MAWAIALSFALVAILTWLNWQRAQQKVSWPLRPNCLLTHYPIVFLTGKKSIFYFLNYWNLLPEILAQHGYEVFTVALPWRSNRQHALRKFLEEASLNQQSFHFVCDPQVKMEFEKLFEEQDFSCIRSLSCLTDTESISSPRRLHGSRRPIECLELSLPHHPSWMWRLHCLWTRTPLFSPATLGWLKPHELPDIVNPLLNRVLFLAERDLSTETLTEIRT